MNFMSQSPHPKFPFPQKTQFTRTLEENNRKDMIISEWIFKPGMLFKSMDKWWGDRKQRTIPHEGLDLCLYKDPQGTIHSLDSQTRIPALFNGRVVKIMKDFLGLTMVMEHDPVDESAPGFLTIFGHANPAKDMHVGRRVKKGEMICSLSWPDKPKSQGLLPHLHITAGTFFSEIPYDKLTWKVIPATPSLTLIDPLPLLDWPFEILKS